MGYKQVFQGIAFPPVEISEETVHLDYTNFSVEHSERLGYGLLGMVNIMKALPGQLITEDSAWKRDKRVKHQLESSDYTRLKCDRGHIVSQRDPQHGKPSDHAKASIDTFTFPNASPQIPEINRGVWRSIESWALKKAGTNALCVQTGVLADDPIPSAYWKIVTWVEREKLKAAGFWVYQSGVRGLAETKQVRIADIEADARLASIDMSIARADVLGSKRGIMALPIEDIGDLIL